MAPITLIGLAVFDLFHAARAPPTGADGQPAMMRKFVVHNNGLSAKRPCAYRNEKRQWNKLFPVPPSRLDGKRRLKQGHIRLSQTNVMDRTVYATPHKREWGLPRVGNYSPDSVPTVRHDHSHVCWRRLVGGYVRGL